MKIKEIKKGLLVIFILSYTIMAYCQIGGRGVYEFLNLNSSARVAALGGKQIAIWDNDLNLVFQNPSLLSMEMSNSLALSYVNYFMDINYGYASYAHSYKGNSMIAGGIQYINYGEFTGADEVGTKTGTFTAAEYAFNILYTRSLDSNWHVGVNIKPLYSSLEKYNSLGIATDWGITYYNAQKLFTAAFVIRNLGTQITTFTNHREPLPFEMQLGVSQRLQHAPFRFSFTAHQLQNIDMTYELEEEDESTDFFGQNTKEQTKLEKVGDGFMRHMIVGVEFLPFQGFSLRAGYNYQRRKELQVEDRLAMVGFSWGVGIKLNRFQLSYGKASYHLAGATNHFSVSTNFSDFKRKQTHTN
ncbi:MAG: type IX secretion system protein PorQ [Bacteroidales bacterium]|nr:type IX secretion system protein PorQ [Bacteroidales bacterium]